MPANVDGVLHVPRRRNIMREFVLSEISAVDRPAQEAAKAVIMKRDGSEADWEAETAKAWDAEVTKRKFTAERRKELAESGAALPDGSYPIETKGDLANAMHAFGRNATARVKAHIIRRAKALGAESSLPEDWQVKKAEAPVEFVKRWIDPADGPVSFSEALKNSMDGQMYCSMMESYGPMVGALDTSLRSIVGDVKLSSDAKLAKLKGAVDEFMAEAQEKWAPPLVDAMSVAVAKGVPMSTELEKKVGELTAALEKMKTEAATQAEAFNALKAERDALKARGKMKPEEQDYMEEHDAMESDDEPTKKRKAEAQKAFLAMSPEERAKLITQKRATDETITVDGQTIRKSVVGAEVFAAMKSQHDRIAKVEADHAAEVEKRQTAELSKRAESELPNLPGTVAEKVEVLRSVEKLAEPVRQTIEKMLKAGEKAITAAFSKVGHAGGKPAADAGAFEKRITEIRERDKISRTEAMEKARKEYPAEFAAYQGN